LVLISCSGLECAAIWLGVGLVGLDSGASYYFGSFRTRATMSDKSMMSELPPNLGKTLLEPLNHAIAAGEREALKLGVPTHDVVEMLLNHLASVVAMIEPSGVRAATIEGLVEGFAPMVQRHVLLRYTTPGGVLMPRSSDILSSRPDSSHD
jgi:hypothetical protein